MEPIFDFLIQENQNIKLSRVRKGGMEVDHLIHGPCEPLFTISPTYLDSISGMRSYNYALRHTDFADNYLHLYLYLQKNGVPGKMYLYVTPESFDVDFNTFHTFRFAAYLDDEIVSETVKEMDPDYMDYTWIPFGKYMYYNSYKTFDAIQGFKHWLSDDKSPYFEDGHVPHGTTDYSFEDDGYIAPKKLSYAAGKQASGDGSYYEIYDSAQSFTWDLTREKYFRKILELAGEKNLDVVLYESTPYWGSIYNQPNRQEFIEKTKAIASEYDVPYLLFDTLEIGRNKQNFVCPLIVGEEAGKKFMQAFAKHLD